MRNIEIMYCYFNASGKEQIFPTMDCGQLRIAVNGVFPEINAPLVREHPAFVRIPFKEVFRRIRKTNGYLKILRGRALGDILMLRSLFPYIQDTFDIPIAVETSGLNWWIQDYREYPYLGKGMPCYSVNLDATVEADHSFTRYSKMHRIDIFAEVLGLDVKPSDLKFELFEQDFVYMPTQKPYIVIQGSGSGAMKSLSPVMLGHAIDCVAQAFPKHKLFVIGNGVETNKAENLSGKMPDAEFYSTIKNAKLLISFDSGPLWISHYSKTPVIAILGSVPLETRMIYHPLYKRGKAECLEMFKLIKCKQCNEQAFDCGGKYLCLSQVNVEVFKKVFLTKLNKIGDLL